MAAPPISSPRSSTATSVGCLVLFFSIFALLGGIAFYFMAVRPMAGLLAARTWREASCVILSSKVGESSDSDGTTYRVEVRYTYAVDGKVYEGDRYGLDSWYSSGASGKQEIVDSLPPGRRVPCWVDPARPDRAILSRDFSARYLVGLVPLLFLGVGVGGMLWAVRTGRAKTAPLTAPAAPFGVTSPVPDDSAPRELRPAATPLGKFVAITCVALFWNGIVSVFVWQAYRTWREGQPNGCMMAFLVPFVAIGLFLLYAAARQFLILFNPRVHLTLTPGTLRLGGTAYVQWRLTGRGGGVSRLRIVLEAREEARYRRGTSNYTDNNVFARVPIADTSQSVEIPVGTARVDVPPGLVPSFTATHNKIIWSLKVACEIPRWPDSDDEYEVLVLPAPGAGGAA